MIEENKNIQCSQIEEENNDPPDITILILMTAVFLALFASFMDIIKFNK